MYLSIHSHFLTPLSLTYAHNVILDHFQMKKERFMVTLRTLTLIVSNQKLVFVCDDIILHKLFNIIYISRSLLLVSRTGCLLVVAKR